MTAYMNTTFSCGTGAFDLWVIEGLGFYESFKWVVIHDRTSSLLSTHEHLESLHDLGSFWFFQKTGFDNNMWGEGKGKSFSFFSYRWGISQVLPELLFKPIIFSSPLDKCIALTAAVKTCIDPWSWFTGKSRWGYVRAVPDAQGTEVQSVLQ